MRGSIKMLYQLIAKAHPYISAGLKRLSDYHNENEYDIERSLDELLTHISNTVPFYKDISARQLSDLPVISRNQIQKRPQLFLSSAFRSGSLRWGKTSGSTGEPMEFALDRRKRAFRTAEMIFYNGWGGYELGDKFVVNAVGARKSRTERFLQRCSITDPSFMDNEWNAAQRRLLIDKKPGLLVAYASTIKGFAEYCREKGDQPENFNLKGIICTSENLDNLARRVAEQVFGCPVLSRYSTLETGVLSQECPECEKHHLNGSNYIVELLDFDHDGPAKAGQPARIVVTDLFSFGMPLVRYDTGDIAVMSNATCECGRAGPTFSELLGRRVENINAPDGRLVSWVSINDAMWEIPVVQRFQFIQWHRSQYEMKVVVKHPPVPTHEIEKFLVKILGPDAIVRVTPVDSIERLPSGKTPYIMNRYKDSVE